MKTIPSFPDYKITIEGAVFSFRRVYPKPKSLRVYIGRKGYPYVQLRDTNGKVRSQSVHRLVLETFVRARREGEVCRHLDGNVHNNHLRNLCWGTQKQNMEDANLHGNRSRGERNGRAKLTKNDIRVIRKLAIPMVDVARRYGVDRKTISAILDGTTWKHVT